LRQRQLDNLSGLANTLHGIDQDAWRNRFDYGQAIGQFNNGQRTIESKRLDLDRQRDQFDQQMRTEEFEYEQARDAIEDERYQLEFDEDVRRFGLEFALDKAYRQGQLKVSQEQLGLNRERYKA